MTELQAEQATAEAEVEAPEQEQATAPEVETQAEASESAPDSAEEREQSTSEPEETPDQFQKRMNKKHWEMMEAKREADKWRKKAEELESKTKQPELEIRDLPPAPDPWEEGYEDKLRERDAIIANNVKAEAQQEARRHEQEAIKAKQEQEAYERSAKLQSDFNERAAKAGYNEQSLLEAQRLLVSNGLNGEKAYAVLTDDRGPQVAMYLAENPHELQSLLSMDTVSAVRHIERNISGKLASQVKKSTAPPPPETLSGKGAAPVDDWRKRHPTAVIE